MSSQIESTVGEVPLDTVAAPEETIVEHPDTVRGPGRVTVVKPVTGRPTLDFRELWAYRELAGILAWRDFRVRYKQTFVGAGWAIIQPFMQMVVMTIVFGKFAKFPSAGLPYPIFSYSGLLLWGYFQQSLLRSSMSVVSSINFITKVYFPRVLLPLAAVVSPIVDFFFATIVMFGLMLYYKVYPGWEIVFAPIFVVLAALVALGAGMFFAAINVRYRDVPYVIPFMLQLWMFLTPVLYATTGIPQKWQWAYALNPMTAVINGFRWAMVGTAPPTVGQLVGCLCVTTAFLFVGLGTFRRNEPRFADTI